MKARVPSTRVKPRRAPPKVLQPDPEPSVRSTSAIYCEHANECPQMCPCEPGCYCKTRTCKTVESAPPPRRGPIKVAELAEISAELYTAFHSTIDAMVWELPIEITDMLAARDVLREVMPKGTLLDVYFKPCDRARIGITITGFVPGYKLLSREIVVG